MIIFQRMSVCSRSSNNWNLYIFGRKDKFRDRFLSILDFFIIFWYLILKCFDFFFQRLNIHFLFLSGFFASHNATESLRRVNIANRYVFPVFIATIISRYIFVNLLMLFFVSGSKLISKIRHFIMIFTKMWFIVGRRLKKQIEIHKFERRKVDDNWYRNVINLLFHFKQHWV